MSSSQPGIIAVCCMLLWLAVSLGYSGCSTTPGEQDGNTNESDLELGPAEIEWPDEEGLLLVVMEEDDIGSAAYYGTVTEDGSAVTLTGFNADTSEGFVNVTVDEEGWPTELVMDSMWVTFTYSDDGALSFEVLDGGDTVYTGFDISTPETGARGLAARITREDFLNCVALVLQETTSAALKSLKVSHTGDAKDHPLFACLQNDEMAVKLSQIHCTISLVMLARASKILEDCNSYQSSAARQRCEKTVEKAAKAVGQLVTAIRGTIEAIAAQLYSRPVCQNGNANMNANGNTNANLNTNQNGSETPASCDALDQLSVSLSPVQWDDDGCMNEATITPSTTDAIVIGFRSVYEIHGTTSWTFGLLSSTGQPLTQSDRMEIEVVAIHQIPQCYSLYADPVNFDPDAQNLRVLILKNPCND